MLLIFAAAAAAMYARALPALLAVPLMALGIVAVAGAGLAGLATTIVDGTARLAPVIVTVIFGALLSRVTLATGIAETIVAYAAEFGGDRPAVLALALSAAVAVLFTSLTGLGAIVMVGSIVLPIMLTVGVPRATAATLFLLAFALGFVFNVAQWTFYVKTFGVTRGELQPYAYALAGIDALALVAFAFARFRRTRGTAFWALEPEEPLARVRAPWYALATPVLPIVLYFALGMNPIVAFALAALYGVATAAPRRAIEVFVGSAIRGVEDVAPAVLLFMGIGMLLVATALPSVRAALAPLVATFAPRSWLAYVLLFGVFSPLALYRGPLNPFGVGIAVYTVLAGLGVLPAVVLVAAVMAVVQVQNVCDPTNTQNVWVANFTGVKLGELTRLTLPYQVGVAIAGTLAVAFFGAQLLHVPAWHFGTPASAAELAPATASARPSATVPTPTPASAVPGLFAPETAEASLAIVADPDPAARAAAAELRAAIGRGWPGFRTDATAADPSATGCARKPYVAVLRVSADDTELGLALADCAGWPVDVWYVPRGPDARADGLALLARFTTWLGERPALGRSLLRRGLAYDSARPVPTYYYTLFKTVDGYMRAYVRPGGPAWNAGLRTNDIVDDLDGKPWWEYGTFQTQRRAYDGLPHTFVVTRGGHDLPIALGAPFVP